MHPFISAIWTHAFSCSYQQGKGWEAQAGEEARTTTPALTLMTWLHVYLLQE